MRVLQVVHQFLPKYVGGTEVYVADLSRRLQARGHEVSLFSGSDQPGLSDWEGLELTTVPGGLRGPVGPVGAFMATFGNAATEQAFDSVLRRFQPDVVHFHHLLGLSGKLTKLAKDYGAATCYTLHDYWFLCPKSQLLNHRGELCQGPRAGVNCGVCAAERLGHMTLAASAPLAAPLFALRQRRVRQDIARADALLAPSRFLAELAGRNGLPREKITLVDFGTAADAGTPSHWRARAPGEPLRVTYLGAIAWNKGVHVLVEACRLLGQGVAAMRVYGDLAAYPDYSRRLQQQADGLPLRFLGPAPREDIPEVFAQTDVLVVPSMWYENSPIVISEAHAAGVPVVASRVGALQEKVQDEVDGLLFTMGDATSLAHALRRLAQDPQLLDRLRQNVQVRGTREQHIDHMEQIYASLVARSPRTEPVH